MQAGYTGKWFSKQARYQKTHTPQTLSPVSLEKTSSILQSEEELLEGRDVPPLNVDCLVRETADTSCIVTF